MSRASVFHPLSSWPQQGVAALLLSAASCTAWAANPVLSVSATPNPAVQGTTVSVDVLIAGVVDLYAYQFSLSFDPSILQASGVTEGSFLSSGGNTFADGGVIDNTLGTISLVYNSLIGAVPGVSGDGSLAKISFQVSGAGTSSLNFSDAIFLTADLNDVPLQIQNGSLQALPVPEPASGLMLLAGLAALGGAGLRRSRAL